MLLCAAQCELIGGHLADGANVGLVMVRSVCFVQPLQQLSEMMLVLHEPSKPLKCRQLILKQ